MSCQPKWKCVAQLGDAHPLEYGGIWIFVDTTGVYEPECEVLECPDDENGTYYVRRFTLEDCTYINGVLSDNKFHPDKPAWFADGLEKLGSFIGADPTQLIAWFLSPDPCERQIAWMAIYYYYGAAELDSYPLVLAQADIRRRYHNNPDYEVKE
jgi:hypothetical protein